MEKFKKLSRGEMKNVIGGRTSPASCSAKCFNGQSVSCSGANCNATDADGITDGSCSSAGTPPTQCSGAL